MFKDRKLPDGIQDFEKLRTSGCLYVDKTQYVYNLTRKPCPYFLGRPRRFGKSLLLTTLKEYFLGKKELFEGLAIAGLEKEWIEYPVFHIDMNVEGYLNLDSLYSALFLVRMLKDIDFDVKSLEKDVNILSHAITNYRVGSSNPVPLLYQSGYLTIKEYDARFEKYIYTGISQRRSQVWLPVRIDDKGYLIPFTAGKKRLVKTGAEFSTKIRGLSRWLISE